MQICWCADRNLAPVGFGGLMKRDILRDLKKLGGRILENQLVKKLSAHWVVWDPFTVL